MTEVQALKIQEEAARALNNGEKMFLEVDGTIVELRRSPLMREAGGGWAHATPDIETLLKSGKVKTKPGMGESEQGLFFSPEPPTRFAESSAFGKVEKAKPGVLVIQKKLSPSGKTYRGEVELEAIAKG